MKSYRLLCVLGCLCVSWLGASSAKAAGGYLDYKPFSARLGVGANFGPNSFLVLGGVEGHIDRFFSLGPQFQAGFSSSTKLYITTLEGRYTLPLHSMMERAKLSMHGGAGLIVRDFQGFQFNDFVFSTGVDFDYFVIEGVTVGLGGILNITGNSNERFITSVMGSCAYHF